MKICSLTMRNFLQYRDPCTLPMADLGLVLVRGDNRVSQALDSNGAGKSSIFSALSMALYGETLNGKRGDEVICRFAPRDEPMELSVELEDDQGRWTIHRTRRPQALAVTGFKSQKEAYTKDNQEQIIQRLGMGFRTFRNAVVFGQGAFERFAQADQADQLRMLDEIQGLDLRKALDHAKAWRDSSNARLQTLTQEATALAQEAETLMGTQDQLQRDRHLFQTTKAQRVAAAQDRVTALQHQVREHGETVRKAEQAKAKLDPTRRALEARTKMEQRKTAFQSALASLQAQHTRALHDIADQQEAVDALLKSETCPTCHQAVNARAVGKTFQRLLATLREQRQALAESIASHEAQIKKVDQMLAQTPRPEDLGSLQAHAANLPGLAGALKTLRARLTEAEQTVAQEQAAAWEAETSLTLVAKNLKTNQETHARVKQQIQRAVTTCRAADYWVEAFGDRGIRSLLIDSVSGFLNERLAYHLGSLAGGEVETIISPLTVLKGGGTRERLSIASTWAWGGDTPGSGSHGQDRRVDLALFAALQNLAESRAARPFPLRIWDEPGDALDARGQELFVDWVTKEARARGTGFLVTHNPYLADSVVADRTWTVILDANGSRVEQT